MFRRDRQYFDYDLLGNPNIPGGQSIPIGPANAPTGSFAWPQVKQSPIPLQHRTPHDGHQPHHLSAVEGDLPRRLLAEHLQGPSLSPSGYQFAKYDAILEEYQRNSTDDFTGAIDWKPVRRHPLTFEEQIDHYKADSYFTMAPATSSRRRRTGRKVALDDYDSQTPYPASRLQSQHGQRRHHAPFSRRRPHPGGLPGHQSCMRRGHELSALAAHAHSLSH